MRLTIERDTRLPRRSGEDVLFDARSDDGRPVTVAIEATSWATLLADPHYDQYDELEQLALRGSWEQYGADRVWRVILI